MKLNILNVLLLGALVATILLNVALKQDRSKPNYEFLAHMKHSESFHAFEQNPILPGGQTSQPPAPGTIRQGQLPLHYQPTPQDAIKAGNQLNNPFEAIDVESINKGAKVFQNFCVTCHGAQGQGDGLVVKRGYPPPPSLLTGNSATMKDGQLFHILSFGQGNMQPLNTQVTRQDRWHVINYVRSMQTQAQSQPKIEPAPASGPAPATAPKTPAVTDNQTTTQEASP